MEKKSIESTICSILSQNRIIKLENMTDVRRPNQHQPIGGS